jgi:magnesium-transporting ATPase (P-type)
MKRVSNLPKQYGLTKAQIKALRPKMGQNIVSFRKSKNGFVLFLGEFKNPLVIILIFAGILSFVTGSVVEGTIIVSIVFASSIINFLSYYRSNKAVELLLKKCD